jgi:hypothetical protein
MSEDKAATAAAMIKHSHRQHVSANFPGMGICISRCPGAWPCTAHRAASALEAALRHHQPEQLYDTVTDYKGDVKCPHGEEYDGDLHFEAAGDWHCTAMPTVIVCKTCCDPDDDTLRAPFPCETRKDIERELGIEAPRWTDRFIEETLP